MVEQGAAAKPDRAGELAIDSIFVGCRTSESSLNGRFGRAGTFDRNALSTVPLLQI